MKNKGITMIALIITIIILLILAGVSIALLTGENGLIKKAELAKQKSEEAELEENETLGDYESKISEYIDNSKDTVTLSKEEYESLKPKSITEESLLMESSNENLDAGTKTLNNFSNKFSDNFETYFTYDEKTGDLTCKKDGWYFTDLCLDVRTTGNYGTTEVNLYVNDVCITKVYGQSSSSGGYNRDSNAFSVFLSKGDVLKITRSTSNKMINVNLVRIKIIKL